MNTTDAEQRYGPKSPEQTDAFSLPDTDHDEGRAKLSDNIARLETDLDAQIDGRKEERFYWIAFVAFLIDPMIYRACESFPTFLLIFMFQLVILAGVAKELGVDWAVTSIGGLLHWISERAR